MISNKSFFSDRHIVIMSVESSIYKLGDERLKDKSTDREDYQLFYDTSYGNNVNLGQGSNPREFSIKCTNTDGYTLPAESKVKLSFKVKKESDYSDLTTQKVALANGITSIFSRIQLRMNDVIVETIDDWASHLLKLNHIADFTDQYIDKVGNEMLLFKDHSEYDKTGTSLSLTNNYGSLVVASNSGGTTSTIMDDWNTLLTANGKMYSKCSLSREVHCMIPLNAIFSIFKYWNRVITNVPWEVRFTVKNQEHQMFYNEEAATSATRGSLQFIKSGMRLHAKTVTPSLAMSSKLLSWKSENHTELVQYLDNEIKVYNIGSDTVLDHTFNMKSNTRISHCMVFFQNQGRLEATSDLDPMRFDQASISRIAVTLNGVRYPDRDYEIDFQNNDWTVPYMMLQQYNDNVREAFDKSYMVAGSQSIDDWGKNPFYYFDLRNGNATNSGQANTLTVHFTRTDGLTPIRMFVVAFYEKAISIQYGTGLVSHQQVSL